MASTHEKPKRAPNARTVAARRRRVAELQRDPAVMAAVREALESEHRGEGVRFEDLKPKNG